MADTPKHSVSVAGIVVDDQDRVLVIKRRDNGHWEPPGGVLELDEEPRAGVSREIAEETGLLVQVGGLSGVYKNLRRGVVALVFRCSVVGGEMKVSDEAACVAWHTLDRIRTEMASAYLVRVLDAFGEGVSVRSHDGVNLVSL